MASHVLVGFAKCTRHPWRGVRRVFSTSNGNNFLSSTITTKKIKHLTELFGAIMVLLILKEDIFETGTSTVDQYNFQPVFQKLRIIVLSASIPKMFQF